MEKDLRIYALIQMTKALISILFMIGLWFVIIMSACKIIELSFGWEFTCYVILLVFSLGVQRALILSDAHKEEEK